MVIKPVAEPSVIHDHELDAKLLRLAGDREDLLLAEVEVGSLPVVDQNRTLTETPRTVAEVIAVELMVEMRHTAKAFRGIDKDCLRRHKRLTRCQLPAVGHRIEPNRKVGEGSVFDLRFGCERAGIDKVHRPDLTARFGRGGCGKCDKRIFFMTARAALTLHFVAGKTDRRTHRAAFSGPSASQMNDIKPFTGKRNRAGGVSLRAGLKRNRGGGRSHVRQRERRRIVISQHHVAFQRSGRDRVGKNSLKAGQCIAKGELQGLGLLVFCGDRREPRKRRLPRNDRSTLESELRQVIPGLVHSANGRITEPAGADCGNLKRPVFELEGRAGGEAAKQVGKVAASGLFRGMSERGAPVQVQKRSVRVI